jgi:hypothetical protein
MASSKGMGIKTSVKSGNFRSTKAGAGMTEKGVKAFRKANPGSKLRLLLRKTNHHQQGLLDASLSALALRVK